MAVTQAMIDALELAYYSGATEVTHGDTTLKYKNERALLRALENAKAELAGINCRQPSLAVFNNNIGGSNNA